MRLQRFTPDPGAARRRLRDVHAEPQFDGDRHRIADDRAISRREPAAAQRGDHLLFAEPCRIHPDQRLDRRPVWRAPGVQRGDRRVHLGLDRLRLGQLAADPGCRPHRAGHGRRADGSGRAARSAANRAEIRFGAGDVVRQRPGVDRPGDGAAASAGSSSLMPLGAGFFSSTSRSGCWASCSSTCWSAI